MSAPEERALRKRAVDLGNSGDPQVVPELIQLAGHPSFHVCRLAVSALGKLADVADPNVVLPRLMRCLKNPNGQVRQYAMKAIMAYGTHAKCALPDLYDIANNLSEKDYNQKQAQKSIDVIEEAVNIHEESLQRTCQKCGIIIDAGEYARSQKAFQRDYCDHCFDEVYLQRRNWDTKVEINKNIVARDGTLVQSQGEKDIAEWLTRHGVSYRYDERIRIVEGYAVRPDFYLPEFDIYIEYWGMDTIDYKIGMLKKQKIYQLTSKKLVSLYPEDRQHLEVTMREKLGKYIKFEPA